jgi:ABC-type glycerol-3-phosphate transport system substrate-binding protein
MVDGGVYWVPFNVSVPVLYVNGAHLGGANDANQEIGVPATWDEFFDVARQLTVRDANGRVTRHGLALWNITWPVVSAIWSEGGELTNRDYTNVTLDDPVVVDVMRRLQALIMEGAAIVPDAATGGHRAAFIQGEASMILDSPAPWRDFLDAGGTSGGRFRPVAALYPAGARGRVFTPGGGGLVVRASGDAEREAAACRFVRFMLDAPQLKVFSLASGYLAFSDTARDLAEPEFEATLGLSAIHDGAQYIRGDFSVNMSVPVRTAFDEGFQRILIRGEDVETVLREADAKAERELARERAN